MQDTKRLARMQCWSQQIVVAVLAILGSTALACFALEPLIFMPAEDAVILWAYSRNLAYHGAITYFANGPHTEGATDFAWMIAVAGAIRCGLDPQTFTALVNIACLTALAVLLVRLARVKLTPLRVLTVAGAASCMPQIFAAASGFATLPDALLLTALVYWITRGAEGRSAATALLFCLFRPDACLVVLPILSGHFVKSRDRARTALLFFSLFVLPGTAYLFWRFHYFHEWLPLPMLVKGNAHRFLHTLVLSSVRTSLVFVAFALLLTVLTWRLTRRDFVGKELIAPLMIVPTAFYWCVRLDQNVGFRFYYYLPLAAGIVVALNWRALGERTGSIVRFAALAWLVLLAMPLRRELRTFLDLQSPELRDIALDLAKIGQHGDLLSSEAGILPYYSGWRSVDPWGLNTAEFAHRFFQPTDVAKLSPSLIHLHPDVGQGCVARQDWHIPHTERSWPGLTQNIVAGVGPAQYQLWQTSYGSDRYRVRKHWKYGEGDVACWFIRRGTGEEGAITAALERHHAIKVD